MRALPVDELERKALFLDHLERRRSGLEQAQWQAPTLTIAAQAFLLAVLTNSSVDRGARFVILLAGIAACLAAIASLLRLKSREVLYSEAIARCLDELGLPDPRPDELMKDDRREPLNRDGWWHRFDRGLQGWAGGWRLPIYLLWILALFLFAVADVVALKVTT